MNINFLNNTLEVSRIGDVSGWPMPVRGLQAFLFMKGEKKMEKAVVERLKIEDALYHIHAFAKLLASEAIAENMPVTDNTFSSEYLSLCQIIAEKAEFCIEALDGKKVVTT